MTVFILLKEINSGERPNQIVLGVYASKEAADLRRTAYERDCRERGCLVWGEDHSNEWDVDFHVEEYEVRQ